MKISRISLVAGAILLLIVSLMAAAMFWSLERLNDSFNKTRDYQQLQEEINTEVNRPTLIYLSTGNATLLTAIDNTLTRLIESDARVSSLTLSGMPEVQNTLAELKSVALFKLRAAGKLRQPQELLINNEREILGTLSQLSEYSAEGGKEQPDLKHKYATALNQLAMTIAELAHSRQRYFSSDQPSRADIDQRLSNLTRMSKTLDQLPRFGLYTEAESNDALGLLLGRSPDTAETQRSERGDIFIQELNSLSLRYRKELQNIEKIYANRSASIQETTSLIDQLNTQLRANQNRLQKHYDATEQSVYLLLSISITLIITIGLIMSILNTRLSRIISSTCEQLNALAKGHLDYETPKPSRITEIEILNSSIDSLRCYFATLIDKIHTESSTLNLLARDLNTSSDTLTQIVNRQQHSTEQASVQIQQLSNSYQEVANSAVRTSAATRKATEVAIHGVSEMQTTSESIRQLEEEAEATNRSLDQLKDDGKAIGSALHVIHNFAEQTNLLALNAAIEAARAGASGRGFAVVADEVRSLAGNTATAADKIGVIIRKLNGAIEQMSEKIERQAGHVRNTVTLAENARKSVEQIRLSIDEIDNMSSMIASATEEQSVVTSQISEVINMTLEHSQNSAIEAENNRDHARQIDLTGNSLMQLLQQFSQQH